MTPAEIGRQYIVAVVVATEVPPDAPLEEFQAVISVIRNRSIKRKKNLVEVVLEKNQFSAVCREDYWREAMAGKWEPDHVDKCYDLLGTEWYDTTDGAMYYYSPISMKPQWSQPHWDFSKLKEVPVTGVRTEYFRFFKEV